ncbi:hypothetical protein [Endozoicomonas sp. 8E]|uniref:hypothetical protein n=1 Tax=Endozoicomonas sp. 8E TaxID=3035692 RepID=UPI0029393D01|nr:hypothetical protein [Endozoicomonas sp. 8E]WOG27030.1 hypothetical protein P6910_21135 [Endozoicomonas sp. 8E]
MPTIANFAFINGSINLESLFEEIGIFNTLTHSEKEQTTTESSQLNQSPPHLSQTDSLQALSDQKKGPHQTKKTCDVTIIGKDGKPKTCGKVCKNTRVLSDHKGRAHTGQQTCSVSVVGEDGQQRRCGVVCRSASALSKHKRIHRKRKSVGVSRGTLNSALKKGK